MEPHTSADSGCLVSRTARPRAGFAASITVSRARWRPTLSPPT